jgi:hypothetical protein
MKLSGIKYKENFIQFEGFYQLGYTLNKYIIQNKIFLVQLNSDECFFKI